MAEQQQMPVDPNQTAQPGQPPASPSDQPAQPQDMAAVQGVQRLGIAASKIIYDEKISRQLIEMMSHEPDPATAAATAGMVVADSMKDKINGIAPDAVYSVAPAIVIFLLEIGEAAGLWEGTGADEVSSAITLIGQMIDERMGQGQGQPGEAALPGQPGQPMQPGQPDMSMQPGQTPQGGILQRGMQ